MAAANNVWSAAQQFPVYIYPPSATTEPLESPVWSTVVFVTFNQTLPNRLLKTNVELLIPLFL